MTPAEQGAIETVPVHVLLVGSLPYQRYTDPAACKAANDQFQAAGVHCRVSLEYQTGHTPPTGGTSDDSD